MSSPLIINNEENMDTFSATDKDFEKALNEESFLEDHSSGSNKNIRYSNPYLMRWLVSGQRHKFRFKEYVDYSKVTNLSKCLIKTCDRLLYCQNAGNIKRHYRRIHNFVILHGKLNPFSTGEEDSLNWDKYFSYDCVTKKSYCKVPGCTKTFEGKGSVNMGHFRVSHTYKTDHNDWVNLCMLKFERTKLPLNKLIAFDKTSPTYRCLFMNCDHTLERNFLAIEKHYHDVHAIIFYKHMTNVRDSGLQVSNENVEMSDQEEFLSDDEHSTNESNSRRPTTTVRGLQKRMFFATNYINFCKETNISTCLIQNCGKRFKGLTTYNIQRHYEVIHNMIVVKFLRNFDILDIQNDTSLRDKLCNFVSYNMGSASYQCLFMNCNDNVEVDGDIIKSHYYKKHEIILRRNVSKGTFDYKGTMSDEDENEPHCSKSIIKAAKSCCKTINSTGFENFVATNYVDFNNKCLLKNCPSLNEKLEDGKAITSHYRKVHNIFIDPLEKDRLARECEEQQQCLKINDFVYFDQEVSAYKCLFNNCNQVLENNLPDIKVHYHEKHMAVIGKSSENCYRRKRSRFQRCESASSENGSFSVANEIFLSDDETPLRPLKKKQRFTTELCTIKNECSNETGDFLITPTTIDHNYLYDITLTKQQFLKSCFGLIIQRDLPLSLFDDNVFFKHLLTPYERIINFHVNANLLLDIILKANDIIVEVLKETFCNKILCLEMYIVGQEKKYFATINVRSIHEQSIRNYLIGFMPINKAGAEILPISEYLMKFNIDKQQVYMTTILADFRADFDDVIEILDNICKYNPDIKKHPFHNIKLLYRSFVQNYSEEIKIWQKLLNSNDTNINADVFEHLNDLYRLLENLSEADVDIKPEFIKEPDSFLKIIKIIRTLLEKPNGEQYVAGDLFRDLLCCELEMKGKLEKTNNTYAGKLSQDLMECKNILMQSEEFMAALYLDPRFNFLGSRLLTDEQKISGKLSLCSLWERCSKYIQLAKSQIDASSDTTDPHKDSNDDDDEYALLNKHIEDIMSAKSNVIIEDLITDCVPAKREPFSLDVLNYWHSKRQDMDNIADLTKIAFTFPASQYMLIYLKENFSVAHNDSEKLDKFLMKHNQDILDKNFDLLLQDLK